MDNSCKIVSKGGAIVASSSKDSRGLTVDQTAFRTLCIELLKRLRPAQPNGGVSVNAYSSKTKGSYDGAKGIDPPQKRQKTAETIKDINNKSIGGASSNFLTPLGIAAAAVAAAVAGLHYCIGY